MNAHVNAIRDALAAALDLFVRLALPLALLAGLALVALVLALTLAPARAALDTWDWRRACRAGGAYAGLALLLWGLWSALGAALPVVRTEVEWRESAEATRNPVPDAAPVYQFGPAVAALTERTYTRTLTLPPYFLQRVGTDGVGVLAPYLTDPSAENVLRLVDTFRRSGSDVVFSRQVTRLDEEPIPLTSSRVTAGFRRLAGRAYEIGFDGKYAFQNPTDSPITARFMFSLPGDGTIRDPRMLITADGRAPESLAEPKQGAFEWQGRLAPGERREAAVSYRALGAGSWHYDLGSRRRRVREFQLEATVDGPVRFQRGTLLPTRTGGGRLLWELGSVVTAQQVALAFPPDNVGRETYLQAIGSLPAAFAVFLLGLFWLGRSAGRPATPLQLAVAAVLFAFGLAAATVLANYCGPFAAVLLTPMGGAIAALRPLGRPYGPAASAALIPATFLSPEHTGLLLIALAVLSLALAVRLRVSAQPSSS